MEPTREARAAQPAADPVSAVPPVDPEAPTGVGESPAEGAAGESPRPHDRGNRPEPASWGKALVVTMADGGRVVLALAGEIDIANAGYLRAELAYLIDAGHTDVVADLTEVASISSSGLGVLVGALKRVRPFGGRVELVASSEALLRILRITRLTQVFVIHATLRDALAR
jgi:anti-sigma B factor antagonist